MKDNYFSLQGGTDLYIRVPEYLEELDSMVLSLPKSAAGKTIKITVIENSDAPFEEDAIFERVDSNVLNYFGKRDYWDPEERERVFVEGHPECEFGECTECKVLSCDVYLETSPCKPHTIHYLRSDKVK